MFTAREKSPKGACEAQYGAKQDINVTDNNDTKKPQGTFGPT